MKAKDAYRDFQQMIATGVEESEAFVQTFIAFYRELRSRVDGKTMKKTTAEAIVREMSGTWDAFLRLAKLQTGGALDFRELLRDQAPEFMRGVDATEAALKRYSQFR